MRNRKEKNGDLDGQKVNNNDISNECWEKFYLKLCELREWVWKMGFEKDFVVYVFRVCGNLKF